MRKKNKLIIPIMLMILLTGIVTAADYTDSLIHAWNLDEDNFSDSIGNLDGSELTLTNVTGWIGDGQYADANGDGIEFADVNGGTSFVGSVEIMYARNGTDEQYVFDFRDGGSVGDGFCYGKLSGAQWTCDVAPTAPTIYYDNGTGNSCSQDAWCHIIVSGMTIDTDGNWELGSKNGDIMTELTFDEFRIYNTTLNAGNVSALYALSQLKSRYWETPSANLSYHRVSLTNNFTGANLQNVNVTLNNSVSNLTLADGVAYFNNLTGSFNFNANYTGYFNISGVALENQTVAYKMYQSVVNISVTQLVTGDPVSNISIYINSTMRINTTDSWGYAYPNAGNWVITSIVDNGGGELYHITNTSFNTSSYDNTTHNVRVHPHRLNVTAHNKLTGVTISNFTVNISSYNRTDERTNTTTNGLSVFPVIHDTYFVTMNAPGYAYFNYTANVSITADTLINFSLYTTNSLNITFYDSQTNTVLNTSNITVEFIGATAQNNWTTTGKLYVDLLSPSEYTIIYNADGYRQGSYIIDISNRSYTALNLYLENASTTSLVLITVQDKFNKDPVQNAIVTIQKYFNNSWATDQILKTDFNGQTEGYFTVSTEFYNFLVSVDGTTYFGIINSNENKKTIYAEDVTNGITIEIDTSPNPIVSSYQSTYDIITSLRFVNTSNKSGYFIFYFDDTNNIQHLYTLNASTSNVINCTNTVTTDSGSLTCNVNISDASVITYFVGTAYIDGIIVDNEVGQLGTNTVLAFEWGATGWIIGFFSVVIGFAMFMAIPTMSMLAGTGVFALLLFLNILFKGVGVEIIILIMFVAYLIARIPSKTGGNA